MTEENTLPPLTLGRALWAIRSDALPRIIEAHRRYKSLEALGVRAAVPASARRVEAAEDPENGEASNGAVGGVAVIPLTGIITPRGSLLDLLFGGGGGGLQGFRQEFRAALADPEVSSIVLDVDSPGGLVDLVPETADEIRASRGSKPIVAVANTMAASAAYFIASQADELVVTPSGDVGSIGVYMVHEDWSGFNEQMGIVPTYVAAGKYKTEGNPDEPLTDEAEADWQDYVDTLYTMFVEAVAAGRGVSIDSVRNGYGEGRTLLAEKALAAGMVDRVATLEQVVAEQLLEGAQRAAGVRVASAQSPLVQGNLVISNNTTTTTDGIWFWPQPPHAEAPAPADPAPEAEPAVPPEAPVEPPVTDPPADAPIEPSEQEVPEPDAAEPAPAAEVPEPDVAEPAPVEETPEADAAEPEPVDAARERADLELGIA